VKQRKKVTRSRLERDKRNEVRPQELKADEMQRSENETTKMVKQVSEKLRKVNIEKGVNLFEFVINPKSFAQSIENLFYVSFLVRDGRAAIGPDEERGNIPILCKRIYSGDGKSFH
jgi:non-structural maintenance of chromosomes element 4